MDQFYRTAGAGGFGVSSAMLDSEEDEDEEDDLDRE